MLCKNCGNQCSDKSKFCDKCGAPLSSINEQQYIPPTQQNINDRKYVPPTQQNINDQQYIPPTQQNINDRKYVPPTQQNINDQQYVPSTQQNINDQQYVPPTQQNINDQQYVPLTQQNPGRHSIQQSLNEQQFTQPVQNSESEHNYDEDEAEVIFPVIQQNSKSEKDIYSFSNKKKRYDEDKNKKLKKGIIIGALILAAALVLGGIFFIPKLFSKPETDNEASQNSGSEVSLSSKPSEIKLRQATFELHTGDKEKIDIMLDGIYADSEDFYFSSSDKDSVYVNYRGEITARGQGEASVEIISKKYPGVSAVALVYVTDNASINSERSEYEENSFNETSKPEASVIAEKQISYEDLYEDIFKTYDDKEDWYEIKEKNLQRADAARDYLRYYEIPMDVIEKMNKKQVNFMFNVLGASNGWKFTDKDISTFFNSLLWYQEISDSYKISVKDTGGDYDKLGNTIYNRMSPVEKVNNNRLLARREQLEKD